MYVDDTPVELASLEKLEQILIAQRRVSEKIIVMPKGQQRKVKGAICNVPVECDQTKRLKRAGLVPLGLFSLKRSAAAASMIPVRVLHQKYATVCCCRIGASQG